MERRLAEVEADFAKNLELLKRDVLNEEEFHKANEGRREERARLEAHQAELSEWLAQQRDRQKAVGSLPGRVRSFLKDFQQLDVPRAKALLQTILKAAHVYRDGRIELEFRLSPHRDSWVSSLMHYDGSCGTSRENAPAR